MEGMPIYEITAAYTKVEVQLYRGRLHESGTGVADRGRGTG
jgi:hypothetical protein